MHTRFHKRLVLCLLTLLLSACLSGCLLKSADELYALPRQSDAYYDLQTEIEKVVTGTVTYCELRMVEANAADNEKFTRIANVGSQQLQARVLTGYAGLTEEYIQKHTVLLGAE